jgi:gliding motility-associated-like protein
VEVTDANGCKAKASVLVNRVGSVPAGFLPVDTTICSYGSLVLSPSGSFRSYLWSTGSRGNAITVTQPGEYTLEVKNNDDCAGKDTMLVSPKECLTGLYVPDAFTPNGDGKNDTFNPLLFGNIVQYHFRIYNRWGSIVFQSDVPGKGWDGRIAGIPQGNEVFVWTCTYQLQGEAAKAGKGTVVLIR